MQINITEKLPIEQSIIIFSVVQILKYAGENITCLRFIDEGSFWSAKNQLNSMGMSTKILGDIKYFQLGVEFDLNNFDIDITDNR